MPALVASQEEVEVFLNQYAPPLSCPPSSIQATSHGALSVSTAGPRPPKPCFCQWMARSSRGPTSCPRAIPSRTRLRFSMLAQPGRKPGCHHPSAWRSYDGICEEIPQGSDLRGRRAGRNRCACEIRLALLRGAGRDRGCRRQDIKLIILKDGRVKDFKLNTQCSAGNGYFLQAISEGFGFKWSSSRTSRSRRGEMPIFPYGCAVFLQADIASFPGPGMAAERNPGGARSGSAQKRLAVYCQDSQPAGTGDAVYSPGRHSKQPRCGQSGGGFHPVPVRRIRQDAGNHRPQARGRGGRHRRRPSRP